MRRRTEPRPTAARGAGPWLAWSVLAAALVLTVLAAMREAIRAEALAAQDLRSRALEVRARIVSGLESLEALLRGGAAYLDASERVTREEFHVWVAGLRMGSRYPGIQAIGFVRAFPCARRAEAVAAERADGLPDFRVWPDPEEARAACSAVVWIEPAAGRNLRAFGYDGLAEPVRRAALERARDRDETALSDRVVLVQEADGAGQAGAMVAVPVYRGGRPGPGLEERRDRLTGWLYAVLRMSDLVPGLLGRRPVSEKGPVHLRIWDGPRAGREPPTWDGRPPERRTAALPELALAVDFGGTSWTLGFDRDEASRYAVLARAFLVGAAGGTASLLVFALLLSRHRLTLLNARLEERVAARTRALDESNAELSAFAYTVAHDLKAPLRAISGFATLVLEEKGERLDAEGRRLLGRVVDAARRGGLLIEGLLRHAALARAPLARGAVDVGAIVRSIASDLEARSPGRRVVWKIAPGLTADADPALLREALVQLVENAWKFTSGRDPALIEFGAEEVGGEASAGLRDIHRPAVGIIPPRAR